MARRSVLDTVFGSRRDALASALPAALAGEPAAVHRARVASRRLREVLPVLPAADARALRRAGRAVRRVTRALGAVREIDVSLALLDELSAARPLHALADAGVRRTLAIDRAKAMRQAAEALDEDRRARLSARLDAVEAATGRGTRAAVAAAAARVAARAARARRIAAGSGVLYEPERLHETRIAIKRWRYALEVLTELRRARAGATASVLKQLQDRLGRAHDLHVLAERIRRIEAEVVGRSRPAARDLRRLIDTIEAECRHEHGLFLGQRDALLVAARPTRVSRARTAA